MLKFKINPAMQSKVIHRTLSLLFPITLLIGHPGIAAVSTTESPSTETGLPSGRSTLTHIRVFLFATDDDAKAIGHAIEEAEHAVEPPTGVTGFWRRKWATISSIFSDLYQNPFSLPSVFDLRRSFQNAGRLYRVSQDFESPFLRDLLASSATMFAITHGGEFATGAVLGTTDLLGGHIATAIAWYGLAVPGLYDFGCWIGQGLLVLRPTRAAFTQSRKVIVQASGWGARHLGLPLLTRAIFENRTAKEKLQQALQSRQSSEHFEVSVSQEELLNFELKSKNGSSVLQMQFEDVPERRELRLVTAAVSQSAFNSISLRDLSTALRPFGWNVKGAFRQIQKLVQREETGLIAHEKTFVDRVEFSANSDTLQISFRKNAVWISPDRWRLRKGILNRGCGNALTTD